VNNPLPAELAEPHLLALLTTMGLDVEYVRAEKNHLYFLGEDGVEVPVLDMLGGYGSLIFGHNHPDIVAHAQHLLNSQVAVHAQFSRRTEAHRAAETLNKAIRRETGTEEPFYAVFGNSGAEAIEIAMKHAELARRTKLDRLTAEIAEHTATARAAVEDGAAALDARTDVRLTEYGVECADPRSFPAVATALAQANAAALERPPLFLTLTRAFHGKLAGSVQLTHNPDFRLPFSAMAAQARFVPFNEPDALGKVIESERVPLFDLALDNGTVHVVRRDLPVFAAFVVEPIQGEGGVNPVTPEFAQAIQRECAAIDCPIVVDEIQSGMGRTGAWFASEHFGFEPDLVFFAKGIAGGLPLAAVTGRAEIMDAAQPGGLGGTFGGNPVAAADAVAVPRAATSFMAFCSLRMPAPAAAATSPTEWPAIPAVLLFHPEPEPSSSTAARDMIDAATINGCAMAVSRIVSASEVVPCRARSMPAASLSAARCSAKRGSASQGSRNPGVCDP